MNDQRSLKDQLDDLEKLAIKNGLYDAHDWMLNKRAEDNERRISNLSKHFEENFQSPKNDSK